MLRTLKRFHAWMGRDNSVAFHAVSLFALPVTVLPYVVLSAVAAGETVGDLAKLAAKGVAKTASGGKALVDKAVEARRQAAEKKRAEEEEAKKPKPPTKTEVRQALRELYFELLEEIESDPLMDDTEKEAAREQAKQKYLKRLDEVM